MTGVGLGGAMGVKQVGLSMVGIVGVMCVVDMWEIFGDRAIALRTVAYHAIARVTALLALPRELTQ